MEMFRGSWSEGREFFVIEQVSNADAAIWIRHEELAEVRALVEKAEGVLPATQHVSGETDWRLGAEYRLMHDGPAARCPRCIEHEDETDCPDPSRCKAHAWVLA